MQAANSEKAESTEGPGGAGFTDPLGTVVILAPGCSKGGYHYPLENQLFYPLDSDLSGGLC